MNDTIEDLMKAEEAKTLFLGLMQSQDHFSSENTEALMKMMGSFTLIRLLNTFGAIGSAMTKEEFLSLNHKLNLIKKPD